MSEIKQQIFQELSALEDAVLHLRSSVSVAEKQTDLEVAILTKQVKSLRDKNRRAAGMIDESISILRSLK